MVNRPTDDELEARAEWLESHAEYSEALDVAALLRACKGRGQVKALVWEDFDGMGAKASGFYQANYLITVWRGRGQFEVAMSYPGYQTGYDGERFHDTLEVAKAAAQADYERRILGALEPAPDHDTWNAAIEAAAEAADCGCLADRSDCLAESRDTPICFRDGCADIRALKKGQTND